MPYRVLAILAACIRLSLTQPSFRGAYEFWWDGVLRNPLSRPPRMRQQVLCQFSLAACGTTLTGCWVSFPRYRYVSGPSNTSQ